MSIQCNSSKMMEEFYFILAEIIGLPPIFTQTVILAKLFKQLNEINSSCQCTTTVINF